MKCFLPIAVVCLFLASAAFGQTDSSKATPGTSDTTLSSGAQFDQEVIFYGGSSVPYLPGDFKDLSRRGWNAGAGYGISFAPGSIGYGALYATLEFGRFPFNETGYRSLLAREFPTDDPDKIQNGEIIARGTTKLVSAMVTFKGCFSSTKQSIAPYFLLGAGFLHASSDSIAMRGFSSYTIEKSSESGFAWTFGVGFEIPIMERFALFAQGSSVIAVFKDTRQYFPVSGGIRIRVK